MNDSKQSQKQRFLAELKAITSSDEFKADIKAASEETLKTLKLHTTQYLNPEGTAKLETVARRLYDATAKLETMTDPDEIEIQERIVSTIRRIYELHFTTDQISKEQALIEAQSAVFDILKETGKDFALLAAKVAIKHGVAALKEAI